MTDSTLPRGVQEPLPKRRETTRTKITVSGASGKYSGYVDLGVYADGRPGEIFIDTSKAGTELRGLYAAIAHAVSLALQYGVPIEEFIGVFTHVRYGPQGAIAELPELGAATSPVDAIFRVVAQVCGVPIPAPPVTP